MKKILVLHGPNLNLLGEREPEIYGRATLTQINAGLKKLATQNKASLRILQSNHEGALIDFLHKNRKWADAVLINPAAYTHTSIALRDALLSIAKPFVEVHLTNIKKRESFRRHSYFEDVALATVMGLGAQGYQEGLKKLLKSL